MACSDPSETLSIDLAPDDEAEFIIHQIPELFQRRSSHDGLLLQGHILDGRPLLDLAKDLGLPPAVAVSKIAAFQTEAQALRHLRQPPHAAD